MFCAPVIDFPCQCPKWNGAKTVKSEQTEGRDGFDDRKVVDRRGSIGRKPPSLPGEFRAVLLTSSKCNDRQPNQPVGLPRNPTPAASSARQAWVSVAETKKRNSIVCDRISHCWQNSYAAETRRSRSCSCLMKASLALLRHELLNRPSSRWIFVLIWHVAFCGCRLLAFFQVNWKVFSKLYLRFIFAATRSEHYTITTYMYKVTCKIVSIPQICCMYRSAHIIMATTSGCWWMFWKTSEVTSRSYIHGFNSLSSAYQALSRILH